MKKTNYDAAKALDFLGKVMGEQLTESIRSFSTPANAKSTIKAKGFDDPLVQSGAFMRSVDHDVS